MFLNEIVQAVWRAFKKWLLTYIFIRYSKNEFPDRKMKIRRHAETWGQILLIQHPWSHSVGLLAFPWCACTAVLHAPTRASLRTNYLSLLILFFIRTALNACVMCRFLLTSRFPVRTRSPCHCWPTFSEREGKLARFTLYPRLHFVLAVIADTDAQVLIPLSWLLRTLTDLLACFAWCVVLDSLNIQLLKCESFSFLVENIWPYAFMLMCLNQSIFVLGLWKQNYCKCHV